MIQETVPVEHEARERIVRVGVIGLPLAAQPDPGAWLIAGLERCRLAWDVVRISPERQQAKLSA